MFSTLIINRDRARDTVNLLKDHGHQSIVPDITIVDNGSSDEQSLKGLKESPWNVKFTGYNKPICHLWNEFVEVSDQEIVCLLNNDIRINYHFYHNLARIFMSDSNIGAVMHPTNHPSWRTVVRGSDYKILEPGKYRQGWDICIRKEAYTPIPEEIEIYWGDDYLFNILCSRANTSGRLF